MAATRPMAPENEAIGSGLVFLGFSLLTMVSERVYEQPAVRWALPRDEGIDACLPAAAERNRVFPASAIAEIGPPASCEDCADGMAAGRFFPLLALPPAAA